MLKYYKIREDFIMKKKTHPNYAKKKFVCSCGSEFLLGSTYGKTGELHITVCSNCHPFYTGKNRFLDSTGRVEKFRQKFAKRTS